MRFFGMDLINGLLPTTKHFCNSAAQLVTNWSGAWALPRYLAAALPELPALPMQRLAHITPAR